MPPRQPPICWARLAACWGGRRRLGGVEVARRAGLPGARAAWTLAPRDAGRQGAPPGPLGGTRPRRGAPNGPTALDGPPLGSGPFAGPAHRIRAQSLATAAEAPSGPGATPPGLDGRPGLSSAEAALSPADLSRLRNLRNIGISAHIDSGKTTLTERILYYTGRIKAIHEVRGKDNVGAKMDSMELEREKGITIQSAATYCKWQLYGRPDQEHSINIIDTPGHVDFTIEVERALRVLDGAVLVLCAVGGVQSQTITVDRQMKRYNVPRICFINKMDRAGANPYRIIAQTRSKLALNAAAIQVPIGTESNFKGVVDLVNMRCYYNDGDNGQVIRTELQIPEALRDIVAQKRQEMIAAIAEVDEEIGDMFLMEEEPTSDQLTHAIRRTVLARTFVPVFMGSAYWNTGVQPLLDGVCLYLPSPHQVTNMALDQKKNEEPTALSARGDEPTVALAFKLEEGRFGQLTYLRVYQGIVKRGNFITNVKTKKRVKVSRLVRMHSNDMEDVDEVGSGEICALFGVECSSGDTFTDGTVALTMTSMHVPETVISLSIIPKKDSPNFSKALNRFQKEDPTFQVHVDAESKETIISGMGELHLQIYVERMKREYNVDCNTSKPRVAYRETITQRVPFNYTHKKQTGGSGQFARVVGYIEPIGSSADDALAEGEGAAADAEPAADEPAAGAGAQSDLVDFCNDTVGMNIPHQYIPAIEKGFREACTKGFLIGHPIRSARFVLEDGLAHAVDSSEMAFKVATQYAFREAFAKAAPLILEPLMAVAVTAPAEYQGVLISLLNKRRGTIEDSAVVEGYVEVTGQVPLNDMFGFSTDLRSATQGKGEFSMEYRKHGPVMRDIQATLIQEYQDRLAEKAAAKR